eukprot:gnl/Dysnectes_brevis/2713_a3294_2279.p1 GENE.gnl/Dysnectes_brevis/2713_a3294_2279~~gnl/Dysnectes_brevis/2713_a3294_2279.p1  ORF type:complete len:228 (+),score=55.12 gnl/Dysnectes_brevis/2713_a3294_2279:42-686(+)
MDSKPTSPSQQEQNIIDARTHVLDDYSDKALEIDIRSEHVAEAQRKALFKRASHQIDSECNLRRKRLEQDRRIAMTSELSRARLTILEKKNEEIATAKKKVTAALTVQTDEDRAKLLVSLVSQAVGMLEDESGTPVVTARKVDQDAAQLAAEAAGAVLSSDYLPTGSLGGVIVSNAKGTVTVNNTLDRRVDMAVASLLPRLKGLLIPEGESLSL